MEEKQRWGCGFENIQGRTEYDYTGAQPPFNRTCPMYYANQPAIYSLINDLKDYKRGALDIKLMSRCQLICMRILETEAELHKEAQERQLKNG